MTRREKLIDFLETIYVPAKLISEAAKLRKIVLENDYREIEESDSCSINNNALIIYTKGRGSRESFQGYEITRVDIGEVSSNMVDIAIYHQEYYSVTPLRVSRKNIKVNLLK